MKEIEYIAYQKIPGGFEFVLKDGRKVLVNWDMLVLPKEGRIKLTGGSVLE